MAEKAEKLKAEHRKKYGEPAFWISFALIGVIGAFLIWLSLNSFQAPPFPAPNLEITENGQTCQGASSIKECEGTSFTAVSPRGDPYAYKISEIDFAKKQIKILDEGSKGYRFSYKEGENEFDIGFTIKINFNAPGRKITFTKIK